MADQSDIDFKNAQSQWEATQVALLAEAEQLKHREQAFRKSGLQGGATNQRYDDILAAQKALAAKIEAHAGKKPGAAQRGDPVAAARQANQAGIGSDSTYTPDPRAVALARSQKSGGMAPDPLLDAIAFMKRATPFLGQEGDFYNPAALRTSAFDTPTMENILNADAFNAGLYDSAQLMQGVMPSSTGDVRLGLGAGAIVNDPNGRLATQRANETAGVTRANTRLQRIQQLETLAGLINKFGTKGIQYGGGAAAVGLGSVGASSAAAKLSGDPEYDLVGRAAYGMFDSPTLRALLATDDYQNFAVAKEEKAKTDKAAAAKTAEEAAIAAAKEKLAADFDSRLFKGLYGYDRKTSGGYNDVPTEELLGSARRRFLDDMGSKGAAAFGLKPGDPALASYRSELSASAAQLDDLLAAAAQEGATGKISRNTKKLIRESAAFKNMLQHNPKGVYYGGDKKPGPSGRLNVYGVGLSDDGNDLVFGVNPGSRAERFMQIEAEQD